MKNGSWLAAVGSAVWEGVGLWLPGGSGEGGAVVGGSVPGSMFLGLQAAATSASPLNLRKSLRVRVGWEMVLPHLFRVELYILDDSHSR
jgi:hypothetical protein